MGDRLTQTFRARQEIAADDAARVAAGQTVQRRTRKPRFHTRMRHEMRARIDAEKAFAAGDARAAGPPRP